MDAAHRAVLAANARFYQALNALDRALMEDVWWHDARTRCVHPGWELLSGWESIQQSWAMIFANTRDLLVRVSEEEVAVAGGVAWVTCTEHITTIVNRQTHAAVAITTNLFVQVGGVWKLAHHHTSPHPILSQPRGPEGPQISRN